MGIVMIRSAEWFILIFYAFTIDLGDLLLCFLVWKRQSDKLPGVKFIAGHAGLFQVDDVFVPTVLEKIKKLTKRFSALPDVSEVTSLTNIDDFRSENDTLIIEELFKDIPATQQEMEVKKRRILANPLFTKNIISEDGRTTALIIRPSAPMGGASGGTTGPPRRATGVVTSWTSPSGPWT